MMQTSRTKTNTRLLFTGGAAEVTLADAIEAFVRTELIGRRADTTIRWYRQRLGALASGLGPDRLLGDVLEVDILEWFAELAEREEKYLGNTSRPREDGKLSPYTLHSFGKAAKRFFKWLWEKEILPVDLAKDLEKPVLPSVGEKGIADQDVEKILNAAKGNERDYAILQFLATTGCRLGGIANLVMSDLSFDSPHEDLRQRVTVREKGSKERTVFLTKESMAAMQAYLAIRPRVKEPAVFLGQCMGKPYKGMQEEGLYHLVKRYAQAAGVENNWNPHQWRHRFGRMMAAKGMPLGILAQIMGHSNVQVTMRFYGVFAVKTLQQAYNEYM